VVAFLVCRGSYLLTPVELGLLDTWMRSRPARAPDPRIALVAFERSEVEKHRATRPDECACDGVPRSYLAQIIEAVWLGGARVLVVDLALDQLCPYERNTPEAHDRPLMDALSGPGRTVIVAPTTLDTEGPYFRKPPGEFGGPADRPHVLASPLVHAPGGVVRGVSLIQTGDPRSLRGGEPADSEAPDEGETGELEIIQKTVPPLSAAAWAAWQGRADEIPVPCGEDVAQCMGVNIPVWPSASIYVLKRFMPAPKHNQYSMLINWAGPVGTFPMYRATSALQAAAEGNEARLRSWFGDRIVIVGSAVERINTPGLGPAPPSDAQFVDQSGEQVMTGLEIHANALQTLLQHRFIRPIGGGMTAGVVLLSSLLAALAFRFLRIHAALGVVLAMLISLPLIAMQLIRIDIWFYPALPATALLISGASTAVWGYARSLRRAHELEEVVAEREAVTATIVHDLKQPLAAISTMAQVLRQRSADEAGEIDPELANRILSQVENALADIDDLLVASPEREIPIDVREFDLAALARDLGAAQTLKSAIHDVEVITAADGLTIEGDPRYIGRVLSNLVDNAIKYWPEGGTVRVEVESVSGHAMVRVIDEGIGMNAQQQEHCFERYRRVLPEGVTIPGTGIGLYSVQRIVKAHRGRVEVVSAPGAGSTFVVTLPLRHPAAESRTEVQDR
jgi:signal transduction histidine kinase